MADPKDAKERDPLVDELEDWDRSFDSLHERTDPGPLEVREAAAGSAVAEAAATAPGQMLAHPAKRATTEELLEDLLDDEDLSLEGEPELLGELLGPAGAKSAAAEAPDIAFVARASSREEANRMLERAEAYFAATPSERLAAADETSQGSAPDGQNLGDDFLEALGGALDSLVEVPPPAPPRDSELDHLVDTALGGAVPLGSGTLLVGPDVSPDLPPSYFSESVPPLDLEALDIPQEVACETASRSDLLAGELLLCERELELFTDPQARSKLHLEAGRLAEALGDLKGATAHYKQALAGEPRLTGAGRGLRRIARSEEDWSAVVGELEAEATSEEGKSSQALNTYRGELLMALGEEEGTHSAADEGDFRALFSALELAFVDADLSAMAGAALRLADLLADSPLGSALVGVAAREQRGGAESHSMWQRASALAPDDSALALLAGAAAEATGDRAAAWKAYERAAALVSEDSSELAAAFAWRASVLLRESGDDEGEGASQNLLSRHLAEDPLGLAVLARAASRRGDRIAAASHWQRLAAESGEAPLRNWALGRAAGLVPGPAAFAWLEGALEADPMDAASREELIAHLETSGDLDAVLELERRSGESALAVQRLAALGRRAEARAELDGTSLTHLGGILDVELCTNVPERARALVAAAEREVELSSRVRAAARAAEALEVAAGMDRALSGEAAAAWRRVLDLDPGSARAEVALVRLALESGDVADLAAADQLVSPSPLTVALAIRQAGLAPPETVEGALREARTAAPEDPRPRALLGAILRGEERVSEAAALWEERAEELESGEERAALRYRAASALADAGVELERAARLATAAATSVPSFVAAAELADHLQARIGRSVESPSFRRGGISLPAAELDEMSSAIRRAERFEAEGRAEAAGDIYRALLDATPGDPLLLAGRKRAAAASGDEATLAALAIDAIKAADAEADPPRRAAAYAELARLDERRGDSDAALMAWETAWTADPGRAELQRVLERAYIERGQWEDLARVYFEVAALERSSAPWQADLFALCGRFLTLGKASEEDIRDAYRATLARSPRHREALFQLESRERRRGPSAALAALEDAVAGYFGDDAHAAASFAVRAGETWRALGHTDEAIAHYRRAEEEVPGFFPALRGWRYAALDAQDWTGFAAATIREADWNASEARRAELYHLAGVVQMDRLGDAEAAFESLRKALIAEPGHLDTFRRLRDLSKNIGTVDDRVAILRTRLGVEAERERRIKLHHELARLYLGACEDPAAARGELAAILELDSSNVSALALLCDLDWKLGRWNDAAEGLARWAKLETDAQRSRDIYLRLGTLFVDHLPDSRRALQSFQRVLRYDPQNGEALRRVADLGVATEHWTLALRACEQLIVHASSDADAIAYLHRVAKIFSDGLADFSRAERALRVALDRDPAHPAAFAALVDHYRGRGELDSIRVQADRVVAAMRQRLAADPADPAAYQVIARAMRARSETGGTGAAVVARSADELAFLLSDAGAAPLDAAPDPERPPLAGLKSDAADELLYPRQASPSWRALFAILGPRLAKHIGTDVRRHGVGRGDRVRGARDPLAALALEVAGELGIPELDIYLSEKMPAVLAVEPTAPPSLILGAGLANLGRPAELRFAIVRQLKLASADFAAPLQLGEKRFGHLLAALLRQLRADYVPPKADLEAVVAEQQKLRRLIPSGLLQELSPYAVGLAADSIAPAEVYFALESAGDRAGLLGSGSLSASLRVLARITGHSSVQLALGDPRIADLVHFAVSEEHIALRDLLSGPPPA